MPRRRAARRIPLPLLVVAALAPALLGAAAGRLPGQIADDLAARIRQEGLQHSQVMDYLDHLTNHIGERLTGSDNFRLACDWALQQFEAMGLQAQLDQWGEWRQIWNRGPWYGRVLEPQAIELLVATPAWTAGTKGRVAGPLLPFPRTRAEYDALAPRLRGAWLFDLDSLPRYDAAEDEGGERRRRVPDAAAAGDDDVRARQALRRELEPLLANEIAGYVSSSQGDRRYPNRIRVFGRYHVALLPWEKLPTVPEVVVRYDQARQLHDWLVDGRDVRVEFDLRNRFRPGPIALHNVIAELKGSERPDEVVVVSAHLDSWHQATGTTDNGTGVASTLEAARILTAVGAKPKRTIRFALWGGEEEGLLGSDSYVKRHRTEMAKVSCVFNHDTGTNWAYGLTVTQAMLPYVQRMLEPVWELPAPDPDHRGPVFEIRGVPTLSGGGGSDHASFLAAGVPAFSWRLRGRSDYFRYTWHTQWDTYDVAIPEYQRHTATVVALAALGAAELPELLPRTGVRTRREGDATAIVEALLGVELEGLRVAGVTADGAAARAGVRQGDVLHAAGGTPLQQVADVIGVLRDRGTAAALDLVVRRGTDEVTVQVPLPQRQGARDGAAGERGTRGESPRPESPRAESSRAESPRAESPRPESPRAESPRGESPRPTPVPARREGER